MAFQVITRRAGDANLTIGTSRATLAGCDADLAAALAANPVNALVAIRNDAGTTLIERFLVIRDWPPGVSNNGNIV